MERDKEGGREIKRRKDEKVDRLERKGNQEKERRQREIEKDKDGETGRKKEEIDEAGDKRERD